MGNIANLKRDGRKPGAKNRIPADVKAMVEEALHRAGGVDYLVGQAHSNPTAFLALVGRLLPRNIKADVNVETRSLADVLQDLNKAA